MPPSSLCWSCSCPKHGVQALQEMKSINESGRFVFACTTDDNDQLVCHFGDDRVMRFKDLVEMRRLLLMTDIPDEVEDAQEIAELLEAFVVKLEVMEEMRATLVALSGEGHFRYPMFGEALSLEARETVQGLGERLLELQDQLQACQQAVEASRSSHYFLNHFCSRELQLVVTVLRALPKEMPDQLVAMVVGQVSGPC